MTVLAAAGLKAVQSTKKPYFTARRISKCFQYFRSAIATLAESEVAATSRPPGACSPRSRTRFW